MEAEKRKRGDSNGETSCKKMKEISEEKMEITVTESEVEEFYAILRRIHVAVTYLKKGKGRGFLNNAFKLEDFERFNGGEEREDGEKRLEFDLNVEPDDEAE
ncbi:NRR repressor like [Heracleum sosnowskyi]|uniref:NRR repressor like n=1 Tax=Heracleum sosnowskyi TaxID=360622 RepID=A0AAD8MRN1_9APIA|nr:NRR repressor like [Heracleum sosnowskyi]KAK1386941.1 NRR repressor like [Heracleum sosnowskyi]